MFPLFFGSADRQLYGVYHMPEVAVARSVGAVLCAPILHEAVDAHRAMRALADQLARAGVHTLRFDYSCTGDSAGAAEDARVDRWIDDIGAAVDELKASRGLDAVGLVGLRFGATLAARLASASDQLPFVALWEPIVDGAPYVRDLHELQEHWVSFEAQQRPGAKTATTPHEIFGNPFPPALENGVVEQRLLELSTELAPRVLIVDEGVPGHELAPDAYAGLDALDTRLREGSATVERRHIDGGQVWHRDFDASHAPVPRELVSQIVGWITDEAVP